ncbi:[FeFe] hydrogenase H-cluster radical SAM maturase HydE [Mahella australiensis]|uniref:Radical SAM domain protein n=1 Tax=Mahella australiensis (strain DSM 15567 / CIP 107919 / 50-1 BON) TaxID=697281 RepID=F3ZYC4_MAHA5|nr:[FeFe] hydrogenase H-cluster radical SAM maturase HydE [Mahella australiensis]AEE95649.1 Radical SAM domain protein [Mahella australiensis 50-1 BON]
MVDILDKAMRSHDLDKCEIVRLLSIDDGVQQEVLFKAADETRQQYLGTDVHLRGLIEFSNYCMNDCMYCGIRRGNRTLERYRIQPDEVIKVAAQAYRLGYRTIVLQSGEDGYYTGDVMCYIIRGIKEAADVAITLSIGERSYDDYKRMKEAGADRYLMRFETSNRELYKKLHPRMDFDNRIQCLKDIKSLGYELGSGFLVGLPGQTVEDIADDILLLKELGADMVGIGPFIPHPDTPLRSCNSGSLDMVLKAVAVLRLIMPDINIPATTAVGTSDPFGRQKALKAGANVIMPNVTPLEYRQLYQLYPGKICIGENPQDCRICVEGLIRSVGRTVGTGYGGHNG